MTWYLAYLVGTNMSRHPSGTILRFDYITVNQESTEVGKHPKMFLLFFFMTQYTNEKNQT